MSTARSTIKPSEELPEEYKDMKEMMKTYDRSAVDKKKFSKSSSAKFAPAKTSAMSAFGLFSKEQGTMASHRRPPPIIRRLKEGSAGKIQLCTRLGYPQQRRPTSAPATAQQRPVAEHRPRPDGRANAPVMAVPRENPFQNVPLFRRPLIPRASLWSPGAEMPAPQGSDDGPYIVKNYVHGPQGSLPPDEFVTTRQAIVALLLVLAFLALFAAWTRFAMNKSHNGNVVSRGRAEDADGVSTDNYNGDDMVAFIPSLFAIPAGFAETPRSNASALNSTVAY
ncbi:hypothetical protein MTO96_026775 [Rhipicephalus appendiculatus]